MTMRHDGLAAGRWFELPLVEQLANVGSDIERTIRWRDKGNLEYSRDAFERALELLFLTVADPKNRKRLKEIVRAREMLIDYFVYDNSYSSTDKFWQDYFMDFNYAVALARGK
ncbi:hypothetical protein HYX58_06020 [Candidatus Dependentiae bacterium]|nr:hypothetical protein [Candidatus Dependentiae bacterium]